ncbi:MAG: hypothetical protein QOI10_2253, partial [Solirubrobacterales bacterium]|nr:hypothetical protein [Solirubrobacterales bacterium]
AGHPAAPAGWHDAGVTARSVAPAAGVAFDGFQPDRLRPQSRLLIATHGNSMPDGRRLTAETSPP